jgi:uncharacterized protein YciI
MLYVLTLRYADGGLSERTSADHYTWVGAQYERGLFLASGPTTDGVGGIALAAAASRAEIDALLASDPVVVSGAGRYDVIEVEVTRAVPWLAWLRDR